MTNATEPFANRLAVVFDFDETLAADTFAVLLKDLISRGIDAEKEKDLMFAYASFADEELRIPLTQTIYVGDGASDAPCFTVVNQGGGIGIGLYKGNDTEEWSEQQKINVNQRVVNIAPPDYREDSELMQSLILAVESIAKRIALLKLSVGE